MRIARSAQQQDAPLSRVTGASTSSCTSTDTERTHTHPHTHPHTRKPGARQDREHTVAWDASQDPCASTPTSFRKTVSISASLWASASRFESSSSRPCCCRCPSNYVMSARAEWCGGGGGRGGLSVNANGWIVKPVGASLSCRVGTSEKDLRLPAHGLAPSKSGGYPSRETAEKSTLLQNAWCG